MNNKFNITEQPVQLHTPMNNELTEKLHNINAAVVIPIAMATAASAATMIIAAALIFAFDGFDYAKPIVITGALTFAFTLLGLMVRWMRITNVEKFFNIDINRDGKIGEPAEPQAVKFTITEIKDNTHVETHVITLPCTPAQMIALADGLINQDMGLTENEWTPLEQGKPFSIGKFREVKKEMIRRGMAVQINNKNRNLGHALTAMGRSTMKKYIELGEGNLPHPTHA